MKRLGVRILFLSTLVCTALSAAALVSPVCVKTDEPFRMEACSESFPVPYDRASIVLKLHPHMPPLQELVFHEEKGRAFTFRAIPTGTTARLKPNETYVEQFFLKDIFPDTKFENRPELIFKVAATNVFGETVAFEKIGVHISR
jgi:hypothetical protein